VLGALTQREFRGLGEIAELPEPPGSGQLVE
jgi:hypothetical protein